MGAGTSRRQETTTCRVAKEPDGNGVMERWLRTLKEECLYLHDFEDLEEACQAIGAFVEQYNREWLIERHGHRTPTEAREHLSNQAA